MKPLVKEGRSKSVVIFTLVCLAAVFFGWYYREYTFIRADRGTGYYLGIVGGVMMLVLLLYPARKHLGFMRAMGSVKPYFVIHMLLGVLGPLLILYHANFSLGSTNSNIALFTMLLVVASGLIGRFLYKRIHAGLSTQRRTMKYLEQRLQRYHGDLSKLLKQDSPILLRLKSWEAGVRRAMGEKQTKVMYLLLWMPFSARLIRWRLRRVIKRQKRDFIAKGMSRRRARRVSRLLTRFVRFYVATLLSEGQLRVYESIFSWWHIIHMPIFILMVLSVTFHIVAVHIY